MSLKSKKGKRGYIVLTEQQRRIVREHKRMHPHLKWYDLRKWTAFKFSLPHLPAHVTIQKIVAYEDTAVLDRGTNTRFKDMEKDLVHDPLLDLALAYWAMQMGFAQESPPTYEEVQDKGRELAAALDLRYILDAENAFGPIWYRKFRLQFGICAEEVRYWTVEETMASKVRNRWQSDDDIIDIAKQDALLRYPNRRVHDEKPRNDVDIGNGKEGEGVVSGANLDEAAKPMDECVEAENSFDENHLTDVGLEQEAAVKALMRLSLTVESNLAEAIQDPLCPRRHLWKREEQLHAVHVVLDLLGASISPLGRRANDIDELDQITSETWTSQDRREALSVALDRINLSSPTDCRAYAVLKAMYGMEVAIE